MGPPGPSAGLDSRHGLTLPGCAPTPVRRCAIWPPASTRSARRAPPAALLHGAQQLRLRRRADQPARPRTRRQGVARREPVARTGVCGPVSPRRRHDRGSSQRCSAMGWDDDRHLTVDRVSRRTFSRVSSNPIGEAPTIDTTTAVASSTTAPVTGGVVTATAPDVSGGWFIGGTFTAVAFRPRPSHLLPESLPSPTSHSHSLQHSYSCLHIGARILRRLDGAYSATTPRAWQGQALGSALALAPAKNSCDRRAPPRANTGPAGHAAPPTSCGRE